MLLDGLDHTDGYRQHDEHRDDRQAAGCGDQVVGRAFLTHELVQGDG